MTEEPRSRRAGRALASATGRAFVVPLTSRATWTATLYHLLDGVVAWAGIVLVGAGLFASAVLTPFALIGVALLALLLRLALVIGVVERWRARILLGAQVPEPRRPERSGIGVMGRVRLALRDPAGWRALGYLVVRFPLGIVASGTTAAVWYAAVWFLSAPVWAPLSGRVSIIGGVDEEVGRWWDSGLSLLIGLVLLALAPRVVALFAMMSRWVVRTLLGPGAGARIEALEGQRSSAVRTADVDRRRIEQDLHDGAQVRLTALALQLGLAREAIAEGAEGARVAALVEEAHEHAKLALREVRDLARGIHPAILTDRGLEAALVSMVGRLPVPVELEVDVSERPSAAVESIAYFVAAEAVTNAIRHADSPHVDVQVRRADDDVVVEVRDRGRGGADPAAGTGLANLRQRVEATGGHLTVQSPDGVGTLVRAVMPCGS